MSWRKVLLAGSGPHRTVLLLSSLFGLAFGAGASSGRVILLLVPLVIAAGAALFWLTYVAKDSLGRDAVVEGSAH